MTEALITTVLSFVSTLAVGYTTFLLMSGGSTKTARKERDAAKTATRERHNNRVRVERMEHECLDDDFLRTIRDEGFLDHHRNCSGCLSLSNDMARDLRRQLLFSSYFDECPECRQ